MATDKHYDVIIIGSGAGGGTLAYALAPTGKNILILERGDYVRREKANWDSRAVNVQAKYQTKEEWRDKDGKPLHPHITTLVAIRNSMAQPSFASEKKTLAKSSISMVCRRLGPSLMRTLSRIT